MACRAIRLKIALAHTCSCIGLRHWCRRRQWRDRNRPYLL